VLDFLSAPISAAYHVVFLLAQFFAPLSAGFATAAAIIVFTVAVRLLLAPLSYYAFRGQARMSALQPKVTDLQTRYAGQPDRLQAELAALYRDEAGGLLAGCLPLLLQLPFFSVMYRLFLSRTVDGRPNALLSRDLLTTPLGSHWLTGAGPISSQGLLFLGLFGLLTAVAFVTMRATRAAGATSGSTQLSRTPSTAPASTAPASTAPASRAPASTGTTGPATPGTALLGKLGRILPYSTVIIAAFVPLAAGLYLLTTTAWTAAERLILGRRLADTSRRRCGAAARAPGRTRSLGPATSARRGRGQD
jgi:YidC/Oxa1 family membrane protein insertase